jgi:hypothetical protein
MQVLAVGTLVFLFGMAPKPSPVCEDHRLVSVGSGCLELPCEYRTIASPTAVDAASGYFASTRDEQRIEWVEYDAGYVFDYFYVLKQSVVWRRPAVHGWHLWWHELIQLGSKRWYAVTDGEFTLLSPADGPNALSDLVSLASTYRTRSKTSQCEGPEPWRP